MAEALGVTGDELAAVRDGALLHDLGKLALPEAILWKPATLSLEEKEIVREHPAIGANAVNLLGGMTDVSTVVNTAKERFDGGGYPGALAGDSIPLGGRIVSVADAFDAMTHSHIYRDAMPTPEALHEIMRCSGSQFDPAVVTALLEVLGQRFTAESCSSTSNNE
jgi:HD-GYP domain-containing protein (c-di-GMP phosphodiesterase class II)